MTALAESDARVGADELLLVPIDQLHESPKNPRTHYDAAALQQLADNLGAVGQITPILVRPRPNGKSGYEIAAGHRRARAAKLAGLTALNAVVRNLDEAQFVEILNIENLQRDDLNALEEAQGFAALMTDAGYDVPKIAGRVGRSVKYVYDRIKLLQLIPEAKKLLLDRTITPGHGILLARLGKEDQKRALGDISRNGSEGGVLEAERIDDSYFAQREPELDLEDPKKARSVRELQQWIDRNVRFIPAKVDQADLAFDLPKTAELLDAASTKKLKVVKITREYRVPDEARDEKERTYGAQSWERADGEPEPFNRYGPDSDAKPSKACAHSVVGLVVAGPGRGDAFRVCVNKEKCSVHWAEEMKARAKRAKEREGTAGTNGKTDGPAPKAKVDPNVLPDDLRQQWQREELTARVPAIVKAVKAVIGELKISDEICWHIVHADFYLDSWNKIGKNLYTPGGGTRYDELLEHLVVAQLPGRFDGKRMTAADGPGARAELAWLIWLARDCKDLDQGIEKAVAARWATQRKAAAKQSDAVQASGKVKQRAGDVARKRKAKKKGV